jgi:putative ABC transport system substrate-binding protein
MTGRILILLLTTILLTTVPSAQAQQPSKVPRIGFLSTTSFPLARVEAFRQGLRELGWVEGRNITVEHRHPDKNFDQAAAELVRLSVDIIVTGGPTATRSAKEATTTIPIVFTGVGDPVGSGFVASLARPGGNVTGLSTISPELSGKRLELLKEAVSKVSRVAVLWNPGNPGSWANLKEIEIAALPLGLKLQLLEIRKAEELDNAFQAITKGKSEALILLGDPVVFSYRKRILELVAKNRLLAMDTASDYVEDGGLMSYAPNISCVPRSLHDAVIKVKGAACPYTVKVEIRLACFDLWRLLCLQTWMITDANMRGTPINRRRRELPAVHAQYDQIDARFMRRVEALELGKAPVMDLARRLAARAQETASR